MDERLIQCEFFVPIVRNSDKKPHQPIAWNLLVNEIRRLFPAGHSGPETFYRGDALVPEPFRHRLSRLSLPGVDHYGAGLLFAEPPGPLPLLLPHSAGDDLQRQVPAVGDARCRSVSRAFCDTAWRARSRADRRLGRAALRTPEACVWPTLSATMTA